MQGAEYVSILNQENICSGLDVRESMAYHWKKFSSAGPQCRNWGMETNYAAG